MKLSLKSALAVLVAILRRVFPPEGDSLEPARGILYGLLASAIVWLVLYLVWLWLSGVVTWS